MKFEFTTTQKMISGLCALVAVALLVAMAIGYITSERASAFILALLLAVICLNTKIDVELQQLDKMASAIPERLRERTHREELELQAVGSLASSVSCGGVDGARTGRLVREALDALASKPMMLPVIDPGPDSLEREIQTKASNGPRVTPADIDAEIRAEYSFTADRALEECPLVGGLQHITICVLVLKNGTKIVGVNEGPVSPENFDPEIGRRYAREKAIDQIWPLLGNRLRDKLADEARAEA